MQTIAIINQKGGTAKTTTAVNLAAALARRGYWTLLADLDPQSSAAFSLGQDPGDTTCTLARCFLENRPLVEAIRHTDTERLELVPGGPELATLELRLRNPLTAVRLLQRLLAPVSVAYDFCVLDVPPALSILFTNALTAADRLLVPVTPSFLSAKGLESLLVTVEEARADLQINPEFLGLVLTMVDRRLSLDKEVETNLRQVFGEKVFAQVIRLNVRLKEAPGHFRSIFDHAPDSSGASDYEGLTTELLTKLGMPQTSREAPSRVERTAPATPEDAPQGLAAEHQLPEGAVAGLPSEKEVLAAVPA